MMVILRTLGRCVLIISILLRDRDNVRYNNGCNPTSRPLGSWSTVTRDMRRHPHSHDTILQGMSIYHPKYRFVPSAVTKINDYKDNSICIVSESVSILFLQKLRSWQGATNGIATAAPTIYKHLPSVTLMSAWIM